MTNYDDFFKSCTTKLEHHNLDKRVSDAALMCASEYYLYFRKQDDAIVWTDHKGSYHGTLPAPVDWDVFVKDKVIRFYEDQMFDMNRILDRERASLISKTYSFFKSQTKLFSEIVTELLRENWVEDYWSITIEESFVHLKSTYGMRISIPTSWFQKSQEEIQMLLSMMRSIMTLRSSSQLTLPESVKNAQNRLRFGHDHLYNNLPPEIHEWIDEDDVPHVVTVGLTEHGEKGQSIVDLYDRMIPKIAVGMPYTSHLQDRMFSVLLHMCELKGEAVSEVAHLIPDQAIRQKFTKTLQAITNRPPKT